MVETGLGPRYRCNYCNISFSTADVTACPQCGRGALELEQDEGNDAPAQGFDLVFMLVGCDDCGGTYMYSASTDCPHCGAASDLPDKNVEKRFQAFGEDIARLIRRYELLLATTFATRGKRRSSDEYIDWVFGNALEPASGWTEEFESATNSGRWSAPNEEETVRAWNAIKSLINKAIDQAGLLTSTPVPISLISYHRIITRVITYFCSATIEFVRALVATTIADAQEQQQKGQAALDQASEMISASGHFLELSKSWATNLSTPHLDGFYMSRKELLATIFPEIGQLIESDFSATQPLLSCSAMAALTHDIHRRSAKHERCLRVLTDADKMNPAWLQDPDELIVEFVRGWQQLEWQTARLAREIDRSGENRAEVIDTVLDIFSKVSEGPFRRFGALLLIADSARTSSGTRLTEAAVFELRKLSQVHKTMSTAFPDVVADVERLLRNAEAHYDYFDYLEGSVKIRHLPPNARSVADAIVDELSYDDIIEQTFNVIETSLAIALSFLEWLIGHDNTQLSEKFRRRWVN